jgi:drug/metabolite transporter (DMT)-like permease
MLFAAMSVIWGVPYLMIKVAVGEVSVPVLVFLRSAIGAVFLFPMALSRAARTAIARHWRPVLAFACIELVAAWLLLADAERYLTSSFTGLLIAATPMIAAILDRLVGSREHLDPLRMIGLAIGMAGVAVLGGHALGSGHAWPVIEVLLVATCYAIGPMIAARYLSEVPGPALTSACLGIAALLCLTPAALTWPERMVSKDAALAIGGLAIICTAAAFVVFFALIREIGPVRAPIITYVNPAVALAAGALFLNEAVTLWNIVGLVLILGGSVLATRSGASPASVKSGEPTELP